MKSSIIRVNNSNSVSDECVSRLKSEFMHGLGICRVCVYVCVCV